MFTVRSLRLECLIEQFRRILPSAVVFMLVAQPFMEF